MVIFLAGVFSCDSGILTGGLFVIWMVEETPTLSVLADAITGGNVLDAHRPVCAGGVTALGRATYPVISVDAMACSCGFLGAIV